MKLKRIFAVLTALLCAIAMVFVACDEEEPPKGEDGVGIVSIEKTSSEGLVDTYTISLSDGSTKQFTVTNGAKGDAGAQGATGAQGPQGAQGAQGATGADGEKGDDGISITDAQINSEGELILVFSEGEPVNLGKVVGAKGEKGDTGAAGATGEAGKNGVSITGATINEKGELILTFSEGEPVNLGTVVGAKGDKGDTGATGATGATGEAGRGIVKTEIIDGYLWITYSDALDEPVNVGKLYDTYEGTAGLDFYPLPDGTCGVMAGTTYYLEDIVIPSSYNNMPVSQILPRAFDSAKNLKTISIPNTVVKIGEYAFNECANLESVILPSSIESIDQYAFYDCKSLQSAPLPESLNSLGTYAFYNCSSLSDEIVFPAGLQTIPSYCFYGCKSLTNITIPETLKTIELCAFQSAGLTNVTVLGSTKWEIDSILSYKYQRCSSHGGYSEDRSGDPTTRFNGESALSYATINASYLTGTTIHFAYEDNDSCHYTYFSCHATVVRP